MADLINRFMWGYQRHYRVNQEIAAKHLFRLLDERFRPQVFLIGILCEERSDRHLACIEPEDDFWLESEAFESVLERAISQPILSNVLISNNLAQQRHDDELFRDSIRIQIRKILEEHPERDPTLEYFISLPEKTQGYLVSVVVGLQTEALASYYRLERGSLVLWEYKEVTVARSLIEAAITELFMHAADELKKPEPGFTSDIRRDSEELVRSAGQRLAQDVALRADENAIEGWPNLFRSCTTISSLRYEQAAGQGKMIVARRSHDAVTPRVSFAAELELSEFRRARKFLELSSHGPALHSNSQSIFGLVDVTQYDPEREDLFEVKFLEHHHWELAHAGNVLMRVRYGLPYLPKAPAYEAKLLKDLPRIFRGISESKIDLLVSLVRRAEMEKHGTLLVIASAASEEASRLRAQAILVEPLTLTPELLANLTPIDGAVILDPNGKCYAVGVILDGIASEAGDSSRGSRYNSALRYVQSSNAPCLAIVISVDGGVNLVPDLMPPVRRSLIERSLHDLESCVLSPGTFWRRYHTLLEWFENHRFYLREDDCERINRCIEVFKNWAEREAPNRPRIVHSRFEADIGMNEAMFYEPESSESNDHRPQNPK